jgi:hypothetical protein
MWLSEVAFAKTDAYLSCLHVKLIGIPQFIHTLLSRV